MKRFEYQGFKFLVFNDVYYPSDDTFLLIDNLKVFVNDHVCLLYTSDAADE